MVKKVILLTSVIFIMLVLAIIYIVNVKFLLFLNMRLFMAVAITLGLLSGVWRGGAHNRHLKRVNFQSERHTIDSFLEHWGTATGILLLMISGFFIELGYQRFFSKNLHFLGLVITLYFGTYFLAHFIVSTKYKELVPNLKDIIDGTVKKYLFRKAWKDTGKYMASQKSSFLVFSIMGIMIFLSGALKVTAYYFGTPMQLLRLATRIHDIIAVLLGLMVLVHILLVTFVRSYRRLLPSLFTGKAKEQ
jgi:cytochrome b subunit of formate dehydrogenase